MKYFEIDTSMQNPDDITRKSHEVTFHQLDALDRLKEFSPFLLRETPAFASVTTAFWAVSEILIAIFENRPTIGSLAAPITAAGAIVCIFRAYRAYRSHLPEALIGEGRRVQEIYYARRYGWQWALSVELLRERVRSIDAELGRIRRGAEFIYPKQLSNREYYEWLHSRPNAIIRLVQAVAAQCTMDVPLAIGNSISEDQLKDMKVKIQALADIYETMTNFERECHAIVPPKDFEDVHEMTHGWTDTIRDGVHQFIQIAEELGSLNKKAIRDAARGHNKLPAFTMKFEQPGNLNEFSARLNLVDPSVLAE